MTSNEDAEIRKHGYKPLKRRSPTPLYYPLRARVLIIIIGMYGNPAEVHDSEVTAVVSK